MPDASPQAPSAGRDLAERYERGLAEERRRAPSGADIDPEAVETYFDVCSRSAEQWCMNLWFEIVRLIPGVAEDMDTARDLYDGACTAGDLLACHGEAWILAFRYRSTPNQDDRAMSLLRRACDGDVRAACRDLGTLYRDRRIFTEVEEASPANQACLEGDSTACAHMMDAPERQATRLYQRACDGGDAEACTLLANRMHEGRGPDGYDQRGAAALFGRTCNGGNLVACRGLADLLRDGVGVRRDEARAVELYERACTGRDMPSCLLLAELLRDGRGVAQDPARASDLYQRACRTGVLEACPTP